MSARPPVPAASVLATESCKVLRRRIGAMTFSLYAPSGGAARSVVNALNRSFGRVIEEMYPLGIDCEAQRFVHPGGRRRLDRSDHRRRPGGNVEQYLRTEPLDYLNRDV